MNQSQALDWSAPPAVEQEATSVLEKSFFSGSPSARQSRADGDQGARESRTSATPHGASDGGESAFAEQGEFRIPGMDYLSGMMKMLMVGNPVSHERRSAKREAEEEIEKLSEERRKRLPFFAGLFSTDITATFYATKEQLEARFWALHKQTTEELLSADREIAESARMEQQKRKNESEEKEEVILLDDEEDDIGAASDDLSTSQQIRKASQARLDMLKKRSKEAEKQHRDYIRKIKSESGGSGQDFEYLIRKNPLSAEEVDFLESSFATGSERTHLCDRYDMPLAKKDLRTLDYGTWINDEIVNAYMEMCLGRVDRAKKDRPYLFSSHFLPKLNNPKSGGYNYAEVRRWTARGPGKANLFERRAVLIPVNLGNTHWCLAALDMKNKCLLYYDSMGGDDRGLFTLLMRYLEDEHMDKLKAPLPDRQSWKLILSRRNVPQQDNCNDCGVFTCCFANVLLEYLSKDNDDVPPMNIFPFRADDMALIRQQMQLDLLRNAIYPASSPLLIVPKDEFSV